MVEEPCVDFAVILIVLLARRNDFLQNALAVVDSVKDHLVFLAVRRGLWDVMLGAKFGNIVSIIGAIEVNFECIVMKGNVAACNIHWRTKGRQRWGASIDVVAMRSSRCSMMVTTIA